ncbi:MAG: glycoside hydrolase family 97 catalytic domain-containing protein, partial [Bacteroidaceae bacterium]|nr:glycoside hydrolase family 97 catalytic domain-containing protein [Bacteroidaceae bacterium]
YLCKRKHLTIMRTRTFILCLALLQTLCSWAEDFTVASPDGHLKATVLLNDGKLSYTVQRDERTIVSESPLGLKVAGADLREGLQLLEAVNDSVDDAYTLPVGKRSQYRDHCNTLSVTTKKGTWRMTVLFRVYDDGFAFRYMIPKSASRTSAVFTSEASRIRVANIKNVLACQFLGNKGSNDPNYPYEGLYTNYTDWQTLRETGDARYNSPTLIYNGTDYLLISEADCRSFFCTSLTKVEEQKGEFSYSWTGQTKDYATDKDHRISCTLPGYTPWRMVVCGRLKDIFETTMTENLCPPTEMTDLSWIKPGVAAWYWGGSDGGKSEIRAAYGGLREGDWAHCELAADMGWPYYLIDAGWSSSWFPDFVNDANAKGVDCLLWQTATLSSNQSFSNDNMDATLKKYKGWGFKGVKVDFWEDDSKETMERMENLYKAAAKNKMLVNLHGCTRPSGLRRTYPHIMTQEGIFGGEQNFWHSKKNTTQQHLGVLFTRNIVGAMDYTPGDFATWRGSILTQRSMGHHMALMTLFESGIVHIAECPQNLKYFLGRDIMKRLPTAWDESLLLEGNPTSFATVARRKGSDWWVSGISVNERSCKLKLDFLEEGTTYTAYIYKDGSCRSDLKFEKKEVTKGKYITIKEISEGGFLMQISPDDKLDVPLERTTYEAEASANTLSGGAKAKDYSSLHASGGRFVGDLGLGGKIKFNRVKASHTGEYILTIYYISKDTRPAKLLVNDVQVGDTIFFQSNGDNSSSWNPDGMGWKMIPINLNEGARNTITIQAYDDLWAPNFDRITIHPVLSDDEITSISPPLSKREGAIYALDGRKLASIPSKGIYIQDGRKILR